MSFYPKCVFVCKMFNVPFKIFSLMLRHHHVNCHKLWPIHDPYGHSSKVLPCAKVYHDKWPPLSRSYPKVVRYHDWLKRSCFNAIITLSNFNSKLMILYIDLLTNKSVDKFKCLFQFILLLILIRFIIYFLY